MIRFEAETVIDSPVESVWAFISDLDNLKDWDPVVLEVDWQRPLGLGSTFEITGRIPTLLRFIIGRRVTSFKVSDYEPNHRLGWEFHQGSSKGKNTYSMELVDGNRTRLKREWEGEVGGFLRMLTPFIARAAKRGRRVGINNVKLILEARPRT